MYNLNHKIDVGDILTYSELCNLFDKKPTNNHKTQLTAIQVWLDIEKTDYYHYKVIAIHPPVSEQKEEKPKRPVGRPRLSEEEKARREEKKAQQPKRKRGRPPLSEEEKERRAIEKAKYARPVGKPPKNALKTAKIKHPTGRPKKSRWNGKTYNYDLRSDAKIAIPARNILLKELLNHQGQLVGSAGDYLVLLGLIPDRYYESIPNDGIDYVEAMSSVRYYTELTLNQILTTNIMTCLGDNNKLFLIESVYFYSKDYQEYMNGVLHLAEPKVTKIALEMLNEVLLKYNIKSEAEMFYYTGKNKDAKFEFSNLLKQELGWFNSLRGKQITINNELAKDLSEEILSIDVQRNRMNLNRIGIERVRTQLYKHGQKFYGYNPDTTIAFGTENTALKKTYNDYCSNVDLFIDKYIRL